MTYLNQAINYIKDFVDYVGYYCPSYIAIVVSGVIVALIALAIKRIVI